MNMSRERRGCVPVSVYRVWLRLLSGEINLFPPPPSPPPQGPRKLGQPRETDRILPSDITLGQKSLDSRARVRKAIPSDLSFNDRQTIRRVS